MALSLSPPVKHHSGVRQRRSPSPSTSVSQISRPSSPRLGTRSPNPNSTNYPTSPYHRPASPKYPPTNSKLPLSPARLQPANSRLSPRFPSSPEHSNASNPVFRFPTNNTTTTTTTTSTSSKSLQCVLCLNQYQDARILPCFHTFCASCLEASCLEKGGKRDEVDSVYCPICMETSELTQKGVQGLPRNSYVEHLRDLQQCSPAPQATCDLCVSREEAIKYCEKCGCNLCEFCGHAHQKQRKTSLHHLVNIEAEAQVGGAGGVSKASSRERMAFYCKLHPKLEVKLFCSSCDAPLCMECATQSHSNHSLHTLDDISSQHFDKLKNLMGQAKQLSASLAESVRNVAFVLSSIQERSETVSEEIIESVSTHMRALQEHKRSLLAQLDAAKKQKERALEVQSARMKDVLSELSHGCEIVAGLMEDSHVPPTFSARTPVVSKLEELLCAKRNTAPEEDDFIQFYPRVTTEERNGYHMFGVLDSRGPSAANTTADGEGLHAAREGKTAQFRVVVNDRFKQRRERGGDRLEANMVGSEREVVHVFISDLEDGTYVLSYVPESSGERTLSVLVGGKHILGSPFAVTVSPRTSSRHRGVFHCCTFCSSKGKKHIRCGCSGTMSGGYSGCGHGHPGHPGQRHWSCCGNTMETSECGR